MLIHNAELKSVIKIVNDLKHPDLKAHVSLKLVFEDGATITFTGFSVRESEIMPGTFYLGVPGHKNFRFAFIEGGLKRKITEEVLEEYEKATIPIID